MAVERVSVTVDVTSDPRLRVFGAVFGLGTIFHELEFALEQGSIGPLDEYMERWGHVLPSSGWSSRTGLALHAATAALGPLLIVLPWSRLLACVLTPVFLLSQLASPERIASHAGLMAAGLLVVLLLSLAEGVERLRYRGHADWSGVDWSGWTLTGLAAVCVLTYVFAFLFKLNPVWFSVASTAPGFLKPLLPNRLRGLAAARPWLAAAAIYGALLVELLLPWLLTLRRTRRLGVLVGLVFHLLMLVQGVADFSVLIIAFYPAFLSPEETRQLLDRLRARPSLVRAAGTAILGAVGIWEVLRAPKLTGLYRKAIGLGPLLPSLNTGLIAATLVLLIYVTFVLGGWLWERRPTGRPSELRPAAGAAVWPGWLRGPQGPVPGSVVAAGLVLLVCTAFVGNNLTPFLGFPSAGAMFMYSGMNGDRSNHFVLHRASDPDLYTYWQVVSFEATGADAPETRQFEAFLGRLRARRQMPALQPNLLRYHLDRMCRAVPGQAITLRVETGTLRLDFRDVCTVPSMRQYLALPIGSGCRPGCEGLLREWAWRNLSQVPVRPSELGPGHGEEEDGR